MIAIVVKALADLRRRRVQAAVIFLTVFFSMVAGTMAVTLMSQTRDPYQAAFDKQRGAHLQVSYSATTDPQLLAKTPATIGSSSFGGPYLVTNIQFKFGHRKFFVDPIRPGNPGGPLEGLKVTPRPWAPPRTRLALPQPFPPSPH